MLKKSLLCLSASRPRVASLATGVLLSLVVGSASLVLESCNAGAAEIEAPRFEVDPFWPKPLPNHWVIGATIGVAVDANDHVFVIHRRESLEEKETYATWDPPAAECCRPAPPVLEFNPAGELVGHWGGEDGDEYEWPASNHGIDVDYKGNVWIGGNGRGTQPAALPHDESAMAAAGRVHDSMLLKFTRTGQFLMQIGKANMAGDSNDPGSLRLPAKSLVDPKTNEVYVADGYANRRVIVYDADSGEFKRLWGAYGNKPDDTQLPPYNPKDPPAQQFRTPVHAVTLSNDGMLYVCDRTNDRIQVFQTDGTYVNEVFIEKETLGDGSTFDVALSRDPDQKYLYVADGSNMKIHVLDRKSLEILTSFGGGGRQPGQFYAVHSIASDSQGNLYTTETYRGQRLQKFIFKGVGPVQRGHQGVPWPSSE
jgi:DNA-binding beta-propeller fold protein YncE